jgi:hypothetical protein
LIKIPKGKVWRVQKSRTADVSRQILVAIMVEAAIMQQL